MRAYRCRGVCRRTGAGGCVQACFGRAVLTEPPLILRCHSRYPEQNVFTTRLQGRHFHYDLEPEEQETLTLHLSRTSTHTQHTHTVHTRRHTHSTHTQTHTQYTHADTHAAHTRRHTGRRKVFLLPDESVTLAALLYLGTTYCSVVKENRP